MKETFQQLLSRFGIGQIYKDASLKNCPMIDCQIVEECVKWARSKNKYSIYISGNTGSGKTYLSVCLLRVIHYLYIFPNESIIYIKGYDLDQELLDSFNCSRGMSERDVLSKYQDVTYLFIDDFGSERSSPRVIRQFQAILDKRTEKELCTVITSNFSSEQIGEYFNDRIKSRLEYFFKIFFPDVDLRRQLQIKKIMEKRANR